jgi:hypothetical protein
VAEYGKVSRQMAEVQFHLGKAYDYGIGVDQNTIEAVRWYRLAAENGHLKSQNIYGGYLYCGRGVEIDFVKAVIWMKKSSKIAYSIDLVFLGSCYAEGKGTAIDLCEAYKFYKVAAKKAIGDGSLTDSIETETLAPLIKSMTPKEIEEGERRFQEFELQYEGPDKS